MGNMIFYAKNNTDYLHFNGANYELLSSKNSSIRALSDDLLFDEVSVLSGYNLPRNVFMTCERKDYMLYQYLGYISFLRTEEMLCVMIDANYWLEDWDEKINILSFLDILRERLTLFHIESIQSNKFDEALINVRFELTVDCDMKIKSIVELIDNILNDEHHNVLSYETITYKIPLSSRYQQVGTSILHYLYQIMQYKNLSDELTVSVSETANLISLILTFPSSHKTEIEAVISSYGLILKGDLSIDHLLNETVHRKDLSVALKSIHRRIATQSEKSAASDMKFLSSEAETFWLQEQIGNYLAGGASLETV